jgi:hypothetical protein
MNYLQCGAKKDLREKVSELPLTTLKASMHLKKVMLCEILGGSSCFKGSERYKRQMEQNGTYEI